MATIPVGRRPWGLALTPDGKKAYAANGLSNDVSVIDMQTQKVIASIPVGKMPWGVAIAR
jgi:YVTN family beta-propeller protein